MRERNRYVLDDAAIAITTGAAGNVVAYMLSGRADAAREWMGRIFRHAPTEEQAAIEQAVGEDVATLATRPASADEILIRWAARLGAELKAHPDVRGEMAAPDALGSSGRPMQIISQVNHDGIFIAGNHKGTINMRPAKESA